VKPEDFDTLFDEFRSTAVRLETLPSYDVGGDEAERIAAAKARRPRPERSVRTNPWMMRMALTTGAGKSWTRVRIVDTPLTDYQRDELTAYVESQAVGEQISLVRRGDVDDSGPDFWLFDAGTDSAFAAVMQYDAEGHFEGAAVVRDPALLAEYAARVTAVAERAVPLNVFLATAIE
jgi:hypothetical protein